MIDITAAHASRIYDYLIGGSDHFAVDREVAHHAFATYPGGFHGVRADARANRAFLGRVVRYLAGEAGIRQFLDIGTGIPNEGNVHTVAQEIAPTSRIVYVDNDPIVLAHAHTMLSSDPQGATAFLHCDLREPDVILKKASPTLDFTQPVAVMLIGLLHVVSDDDDPHGLVGQLMDAVVPGSYLAISHITRSVLPKQMSEVVDRLKVGLHQGNPPAFRSIAEIREFFGGLELVDPGVVEANKWRPAGVVRGQHPARTPLYVGLARKP